MTVRLEPDYPGLLALCDTVSARPNIAAYLSSMRRFPFSEEGLFRHFAEPGR
jgi:glutathione S-transferase